MLPGFRVLLAAIMLTVSLLVFGLGAAALLRASHERFASLPKQPAPAAILIQTAEAAPPTLSLLRVEPPASDPAVVPRPVPEPEATLQFDTLLPTDRIAMLSIVPRADETIPPLPLAVEMTSDVKAEMKPQPSQVEAKIETAPEPSLQIAPAPVVPPIDIAASAPVASSAMSEPTVMAKADEPSKAEASAVPEAAPRQIAALSEPDVTGTIAAIATPEPIEPPLVNSKPVRRPPVPRNRPADADVVAALPDAAVVAAPVVAEEKPVLRRRRPVAVKRVAKPKRRAVVSRPAPQRPVQPSPFGGTGFGT